MKYYQSISKTTIFIVVIAFMCGLVQAQIPGVTVFPPQLNNPSPFLSDWQSRASTAIITVTNTGAAFPGKVWVEFKLNGSLVAFSQPAKLPVTMINPGQNNFNGEQLVPLSSVHFENNVDQNSKRAGRIPDGQVCLIVHVLKLQTGQESVSPDGCSIILSYSPPQLILPLDNSELCKLGSNNVIDKRNGRPLPIFQWTPIVPAAQSPVIYHFAIYEVLPGQAPIAAFRGAYALFQRDLPGLTNLLWPTEFFLPEKGKTYVWSVRALDERGNPFVLTNDGWATPYTFTVSPNCDQSASGGKLTDVLFINPPTIDFGSVNAGMVSQRKQITLTNIGTGTISIHPPNIIPPGINEGFTTGQPSLLVLEPGMSTSFDVAFKPATIGMADGSVRIATDGGNAQVELKGQGVDAAAPTIKIISPAGGENISSGSQFQIKFLASDDNALTNYKIQLSTDGGTNFSGVIIPPDNSVPQPPMVIWSVPSDLQTSQGIIKISAQDKNGDKVSALSGLFSIGSTTGQNGNPGGDQNIINGITDGQNSSGHDGNSSNGGNGKTKNTNMADVYVMKNANLELDGKSAGWVYSAEGGHVSSDVIVEKPGGDTPSKKHIGGVKYEDITVTCGAGMSNDFYEWIQNTIDKKYKRKDGAVIAADYDHKELTRLNFYHALISEIGLPGLDATAKDAAKMSIKFKPEMTKFEKTDPSKSSNINSRDAKVQKKWTPANFRLKIDGLEEPCKKVSKIEAITVKQKNVENAVGDMRDYKIEPGKLEFPNLVFVISEIAAKDFKIWFDESVINGKGSQKNGSLQYLAEDGTPLFTLTFHNLGIFKMTPDKVEAGNENIKKVKIELYVEEMKFEYKGTWD